MWLHFEIKFENMWPPLSAHTLHNHQNNCGESLVDGRATMKKRLAARRRTFHGTKSVSCSKGTMGCEAASGGAGSRNMQAQAGRR